MRERKSCFLPFMILAAILSCFGSTSAPASTSCSGETDVISWITSQPTNLNHEGRVLMKRLPAGTSIDVLVADKFSDAISYRGLIRWRDQDIEEAKVLPEWLPAGSIWSRPVADDSAFIKAGNSWARGMTLLSFFLPVRFASIEREITISLVACDLLKSSVPVTQGSASPESLVVLNAPTSARWFSISMAVFAVALSYLAAAFALSRVPQRTFSLDPIVITAGWDGTGSPAKIQVLFFSLIVIGLLTYILCRAGLLSDLSVTILLLLGISSVGALAARATDIDKHRLGYENWAWLVRKGWLPIEGFAGLRRPRWGDLFTVQGEFDVSRFQVIIFSLVVGLALLQIGLTDLATFSVPEALLGLIGLSQVTYVFGKVVGKDDVKELDRAITDLRTLENAFVLKAGTTDDPAPLAFGAAPPPPGDIASAIRRAKGQYDAYVLKEQDVRTMFEASLGIKLGQMLPRWN